jgi:LEA14-like dessication related protein
LRVRRTLATLPALILVTCFATSCGPLFEKPRVSVKRVDLVSVDWSGVAVSFVFAVENPNVLGLDLAKLSYQLTVDGHAFVAGAGDHPLHLPAQGTGEVTLPVSFRFVDLAQALASLFTKRQVPYTIATRLGFGTPLGVLEVPLSYAGTMPVPQLPSIVLGAANVGGLDVAGATVSLQLNVRNNNSFALPLGPLRYGLSINGAPIVDATTPPSHLPAGGVLPLVISAHLDFLRVGLGILRAIQSRSATLALDGTFALGGYNMPVHLQTTLR